MTKVTFRVDVVADGRLVTLEETDLQGTDPDWVTKLADDLEELVGAIVIDVGDQKLAVPDDLTAAAYNLCFAGPKAILDDPHGHFLYRTTLATWHAVMIPLAYEVRIFGEETPVITTDRAELLPALYRCGQRVIELLERVGAPAEAALTAEDLRTAARTTEAALKQHNLAI